MQLEMFFCMELQRGRSKRHRVKPYSEAYRFQALAASSWWALTVPRWEKSLHSLDCGDATEQVNELYLLMLEGTDWPVPPFHLLST